MVKLRRLFNKRNAGGYTLVEVIVASALLGVLIIGVLGFVTPVFSILQSSDEVKKAERTVATIEHYISKSLRKSLYVKVYNNATLDDLNGWVQEDDDDLKDTMLGFFDAERKKTYTLQCLAIEHRTDNNIRNSSTGATAQKYMLYNYTYNWSTGEFVDPVNVFEECFYEDLYPKFSFEPRSVWVNPDTNAVVEAPTTAEAPETEAPAATAESGEGTGESPVAPATPVLITPAMVMELNIYNSEAIDNDINLLFKGKSFIEINNVKNTVINDKKVVDYKIFDSLDLATDATNDGKNIYIIYITRNIGTDVAGG